MTRVEWAESALNDIYRHTAYIAQFNPRAADRLARYLIEAGKSLSNFPERGRPGLAEGSRELMIVWPYILVYQVTADVIEIIRVWHGAQHRQ